MSDYFASDESILYLWDADLDALAVVRVIGGVDPDHLARDVQFLERRARLIIEKYKAGEVEANEHPALPNQYRSP